MARTGHFARLRQKAVINHASLSGPDCQQLDCFGYDRPFDSIGLPSAPAVPANFLRPIIQADLDSGKHSSIVTRFPPEPNGYLHIGHAKSICVNFGLAKEFGGVCHLRFDDTNPAKEDQEYIDAIQSDVKWLGFDWAGDVRYASDYFDQLHDWAVELIKQGKAYVCDLTPEQAKEYRGNLKEPGKNSPFRERSVEDNLDLFARMKAGEFKDGERVLRAKIDMASPNMNLRDPILYRIRHAHHHGCHRGHYPLDLHPGVRRASSAVRLVPRQPAGAGAPASVRVQPPEPELHHHVQAQAEAAG